MNTLLATSPLSEYGHLAEARFGERALFEFPNGFGASLIRSEFSYGGRNGEFEIAVLKNGHITYETPITNDVLGYLSMAEAHATLEQIYNLEAL